MVDSRIQTKGIAYQVTTPPPSGTVPAAPASRAAPVATPAGAASEAKMADSAARLLAIQAVVDEQANDAGIWFHAETAAEAYLQQELRRLHEVIEGKTSVECVIDFLRALSK